jgi:hypothetical protein
MQIVLNFVDCGNKNFVYIQCLDKVATGPYYDRAVLKNEFRKW